MARAQLGEQLVAAHPRHDHVGDDDVEAAGGDAPQGLGAVGRGLHRVARLGDLLLEEEAHLRIVLDDEDPSLITHAALPFDDADPTGSGDSRGR